MNAQTNNPLKVEHIRVRKGTLDLEVRCDIDALHVTSEQALRVLELLPNLAHHVCVNDAGNESFGAELEGTELPHLLEHVIIELQGRDSQNPSMLTGNTSWLEELAETAPQGYALMRTSVTFENDFTALAAMNEGLEIIATVCRSGPLDALSGEAKNPWS